MSVPARIVSVAPRYRPITESTRPGHWTIYQDDLRAAAVRLGLPFVILAEKTVDAPEGVAAILDASSASTVAASASAGLDPGDLVMVYEGSLQLVEAFSRFARERPENTFVVNLFKPERGLVPAQREVMPVDLRYRRVWDLPPNLIVSAETQTRAALARRLGIPRVEAWRLHSTLWNSWVGSADVSATDKHREQALRVLVPLSERGYSERSARDIAYVLHRLLHSRGLPDVRLTLTGADSERFSARVRGPRLEALGATRVISPPERDRYARMFMNHDVVWIPEPNLYRSQSSGKTLDALVLGRPVVAHAGTWPVDETSRWVGARLEYRSGEEALRLLLDVFVRVRYLHEALVRQMSRIRVSYGPEMTLRRVLELAESASGPVFPMGLSAPDELPPVSGMEASRGTRIRGHLRPREITALLAARRSARIGVLLRVIRRARRRGVRIRRPGSRAGASHP